MSDLEQIRDALESAKTFLGQDILWKESNYVRGHGEKKYSELCVALSIIDRMIETPAPTDISKSIYYPECWDTAAYPTVNDALAEMFEWFKCDNPEHAAPTPAPTEKVYLDSDYHKLCAQCWDALGITEYTGRHFVEHIRDLVEQNQTYKKRFNIGDIVQVSPNCEYFEDWKGEKLEIVGIYRTKPIGYSTPNETPPIKYSVKDIKDNWNYGFTDDFDGNDLLLATQKD